MPSFLPALYINVTERCNMQCEYCPAYGENWESTEGLMPLPDLLRAVGAAVGAGVTCYRISGGEPMIFPDRVLAILDALQEHHQRDIILNSNGFNLFRHIDSLAQRVVRKVKISLDTVDRARFRELTNVDRLDDVLRSILAVRAANIGLELNLVLLRSHLHDFWSVLEFCVTRGISLKVLDLVLYDSFVRNPSPPATYFQREYYSPRLLEPELQNRFGAGREVRLSGDRGIPMTTYSIGEGATLTLKDGSRGSTFGRICIRCKHYPCQEGLFHLSLSAEGRLTPCRLRRDLTAALVGLSDDDLRTEFNRAVGSYDNIEFLQDTQWFPVREGDGR